MFSYLFGPYSPFLKLKILLSSSLACSSHDPVIVVGVVNITIHTYIAS